MYRLLLVAATLGLALSADAVADSAQARCDIYPKGSDSLSKMIGCTFSQRQGFITIRRADGVTHELAPVGDDPDNYRDQGGRTVLRELGIGDQGQVFRFPDESIFLYWSTAGLDPPDDENPTAPFSTKEFDATATVRCRASAAVPFGSCPAGAMRMDAGQASVTVQSPGGERFTINFMTGYVNATNREADARLDGDTWTVVIDGKEIYEVPLALIEGG